MSTFDAAFEAFSEGVEGTEAPVTPEAPAPEAPVTNQPDGSAPAGSEASQPEDPASREIDLTGLPEEAQIFLRAREREMQADYTRKTQELAEQRRQAEQHIAFVEALNSDPEFALNVFGTLQDQLAQAGYLEQQAALNELDDEFGMGDPVSDPYARELAEMRAWRQNLESQLAQNQMQAQLDRQIAELRSAHPDYTTDDVQAILDLGFATGGDLRAANEAYRGMQDRILARYLQNKVGVKTPAPIASGQGTPVPEDISEADDLTLRAIAQERLINAIQNQ